MSNKKNLTPFQNENAQSGFKDEKGEVVIAAQYDRVYAFCEGLARVRKGGLWGYIDEDGRNVIKIQFDEAKDFSGGLAQVAVASSPPRAGPASAVESYPSPSCARCESSLRHRHTEAAAESTAVIRCRALPVTAHR